MTFPGSTSNWSSYVTQITLCCDYCSEFAEETHEDQYDADRSAETDGWYTGAHIDGSWYDHVCSDCVEQISICEWCEELFNHENTCYCCDVILCSEYCRELQHEAYWKSNPALPECEECEMENPLYLEVGNTPTHATSWRL